MRLAPRTFVIQWDLHAWAGVVASVLLASMFYAAIFGVFFDAIEIWQDPALHVPEEPGPIAWDEIARRAIGDRPIPRGGRIAIAVADGTRLVHASVHRGRDVEPEIAWIDPQAPTILPERTRLARELYLLHYMHRVPGGLRLAGVLAIAMIVATLSGLAIHAKDLPAQLWRIRRGQGLRVTSSDVHKVVGVLGVPFVVMVSWSGSILAFADPLDAAFLEAVHGGSIPRMIEATGRWLPPRPTDRELEEMPALATLAERAQRELHLEHERPAYVDVRLWGDEAAYGRVYFEHDGFGRQRYVVLRARDLEVLDSSERPEAPVRAVDRVIHDLHFAAYGGWWLKWLWALAGLGGCVVILTGNVIWILRRDPERARPSTRALERVSIGVPGGVVVGVAAYFLANRVLPLDLAHRADLEVAFFVATIALVAIAAGVARDPRRAAIVIAAVASALHAIVVGIDLALHARSLAILEVATADALLASLALAWAAIALAIRRERAARPS